MASSHARSISLPSRSHPTIPQIQELLVRLRPVDLTSFSLSAINGKLSGLGGLFDLFDKFLLLPQTQQALSKQCNEVDELLDGILLALDVCGIAKDVLSESKEHIQELQSILRRRRADEFEVAKEVGEYLASRKKARKVVHKVLKELKTKSTYSPLDKGNTSMTMLEMSKQVQGTTLTTLQSLLFYISGYKTQPKLSSWTLVSNLIGSKNAACSEEAKGSNEFQKVVASLQILLLSQKTRKSVTSRIENVQTDLGKMELSVEDLEHELECLHRNLIRARVSLLNILNN